MWAWALTQAGAQTDRPHVPHPRARWQAGVLPGQHVFHQAVAHQQHGVVDFFQGREKPRAPSRTFAGQGHNGSGPNGQDGGGHGGPRSAAPAGELAAGNVKGVFHNEERVGINGVDQIFQALELTRCW